MTDEKRNASSGPRSDVNHLTVQVREGDKKALSGRHTERHTAGVNFLDGTGGVTSTFWAFAESKINGLFVFTFNFGSNVTVNAFSQVAASITELDLPDRNPFLGDAPMSILNVVPSAQKVIIEGNIQWNSPLDFRLNLIIAN
jgi:hypothetical protein